MLKSITPVILTLNEEANIRRCLDRLYWAKEIVVVDSYSSDRTEEIVAEYKSVRLFKRHFDSHSSQWQFAISQTDIRTNWILALDADYLLSHRLIDELSALVPPENIAGFRARFDLCVYGIPLRSAFYPPVTVLFRGRRARYAQDGHTQRVVIDGDVANLNEVIKHDDRKPLEEWLFAQRRYSKLEAAKLNAADTRSLKFVDRMRKLKVVAPLAMPLYCLLWRRGVLDGWAGLYYALQRTLAEIALSLYLIEASFRNRMQQDEHTSSDDSTAEK